MDNRIRDAFDQVTASQTLKEETLRHLRQKMAAPPPKRTGFYRAAMACLLFLVVGITGYWFYFVPTSFISVDINPSFELGINRFDRVVSVEGYNQDGRELCQQLSLDFLTYSQALEEILNCPTIVEYLQREELLSLSVAGKDQVQSQEILQTMETACMGKGNVFCQAVDNPQQVQQAHEAGFSFGKYQAYLELKALVPEITPQDVQNMTMREIRDLIREAEGSVSQSQSGNYAPGGGQGNGWRGGKNS